MRPAVLTATLATALVAAAAVAQLAACAGQAPGRTMAELRRDDERKSEIQALWIQIRDWRQQAGLRVAPPLDLKNQMLRATMATALRVCPDEVEPATPVCRDVCSLADAICENAESICRIADELPGDSWAADKCADAKASCREAKERCCKCDAGDGDDLAED
jgi:hypothetical protein